MNLETELIDWLDLITYSRPLPNREFDQIYMKASNMYDQAKYINKFIEKKDIVFLGDGDGMSILLSVMSERKLVSGISSIEVLDFDERILTNIKTQIEYLQIKNIPFSCKMYNVIMPIEKDYLNRFNFFYINPPYGSKNSGLSCKIWIDRCIDLCTEQCSGCIIIPYDYKYKWTIINMKQIQQYLLDKGFIIRDMVSYMHQYYLDDNPDLKSASLIVEKVSDGKAEYSGRFLDTYLVKNLYGEPRKIPKYIFSSLDDRLGLKEYNWIYGKDGFWESEGNDGK